MARVIIFLIKSVYHSILFFFFLNFKATILLICFKVSNGLWSWKVFKLFIPLYIDANLPGF